MAMNQGEQFWIGWSVQLAIAVATFGAVLVALFGDWIRARLFKPHLSLALVSPVGESTTLQVVSPSGDSPTEKARFYHVRVSNKVPWPKASQVQVYLIRVEEPGPDGALQVKWASDVPIKWKFQEINPLVRTVGPAADCDLCSVVKDKWLELHPLIVPNNLARIVRRREAVDMVVNLEARSNEATSFIKRFRISWDGKWEDGDTEMTHHLVVKEIT